MSDAKPGRGSDQFPLRLPDGMRERIKASADANGRSMNSEIVRRLGMSLDEAAPSEEQVLYIILDADGHPSSWTETFEHLQAIRKAGKFSPSTINTLVYNGPRVSSADREEKADELYRWYRSQLRKK